MREVFGVCVVEGAQGAGVVFKGAREVAADLIDMSRFRHSCALLQRSLDKLYREEQYPRVSRTPQDIFGFLLIVV